MVQQSTNAPDVSPPVAWVIGGTRGIGAAVVEHLARDGWTVVASGRGEAALERTHEGRWWRPVDIRDGAAVEGAAAELAQRLGRLDAAVVSVREQGEGSFSSLTDEAWQSALDTKLIGFVRVARSVLPQLEASSGALVSLVGAAATVASASHPLGCVNAALRHVVRGLAMEWGPRGVRIVGVSPGPTRTDTLVAMIEDLARRRGVSPDAVEEEIARATYRGRMLHTSEVAELVGLLLDERSASLNGTVVQADDGSIGGGL